MNKKRTLTAKQLAKELHITERWISFLARENRIPATKKGHIWLFNKDEVRIAFYIDNSFSK